MRWAVFVAAATGFMASTVSATGSLPAIGAGGYHSCYVTSSGSVKCWGNNDFGKLGDGTTTHRSTPVDVSGLSSGVQAIATPGYVGDFTCALTTGGGVKCWGLNTSGQLGNGTLVNSSTPVDVSGLTSGVVAITAGGGGGGHACALTSSGGVKCWGYNATGQVGDGTTSNRSTPVDVSGLSSGVIAIGAGGTQTCALTSSGGAKCWGRNVWGSLGDGTTTTRLTPVDVSGLSSGVAAIAGGSDHTCALTTGGGVKCWGYNGWGQLGDGTTTTRLTPVDVSGLSSGVAAITGGLNHTCALTNSGTARCWGSNDVGQIGDGTTTTRLTPVDVSGLSSSVAAIAASVHSCALLSSGAVKCWGLNNFGQLGDGTTTTRLTPVDVTGLPPAGGCVAPPSDMVSWWPGDGNANDIISTNHGALVNGATFASGIVGQGFSFDGVDDEVLIGNPTNLRLQDFTIDAWIRLNTLTISGFAERIAGYSIGGYGFFLAGPSVVNANGASAVRQLSLDKAGFDMVAAPFAINDTGWHHVAVTKNGGTVTFYLDGVPGAAQRGGLPIASYNPGFVFNTYFALGNLDGQTQPFPGMLDEVEVFNRTLSAAEIQTIFNAGSAGKCKTALPDTTPDSFTFTDLTGVPLSTMQTSNAITVSGITASTAITVSGGEYERNSSGIWSSSAGTVVNGDIVRVRHTSAATYSTAAHTTLTIGGVSDTFTSITLAADTTPDPFTFTDQTGVSLNTIILSNTITVTGINSSATISIPACTSTSCEYAINGGTWTGAPGTMTNGQTAQVRQRSAATLATTTHLTLTIGGVSDTFSVTTLADTIPPVLTLPADITTPATSPAGAVVTYVATATDAIDGAITPTCTPPSGSTFSIGTTTVNCSASDTHGNTASGSLLVTVTVALTIAPTPLHGSITSSVGGINCGTAGSACTAAFGGGATVTLSRTADSGYVFGGWTGACSAQGLAATCTLTMDANKTVGAIFNLHPMNLIVNSAADLVDALPGDGICATATGVCTLRAAVMEANAMAGADIILFDSSVNGTPITLTITGAGENAAATGDLDVTGSLTITGNGMDNTIIQACDATANPSCSGIDRLFDVQDGATLNLSGVTLRNGRGSSEPFGRSGGAIRVGLHLPWEGGNGTSSSLTLSDSTLLNNVATVHGGAISSIGSVTISNSVITGNRAVGGSGGGVLNNLGGTLIVNNSTFSANTADGGGGAIFANPGSLPAPVTITNSTISGNTSGGAGGGLFQNGGSSAFIVTNTTISGNRAAGPGGGIISAGSGTMLANVTVTGNTADSDGNNDGDGGGLQGTATVKNSIVAGNSDLSAGASAVVRPDCAGTISSQGYNLIGNGIGCSGAVNGANGDQVGTDGAPIDPRLGPLQNNGGSTETHLLLGGSSAIDAANPAGCTDSAGALLTTDQRGTGYPRAIDADSDGTVRCDIGAVEILDGTPPVLSLPGNITTPATGPAGAVVTYVATATDAIDGIRPVICTPPSGSTFPIGTTPVTCSASDTHGNTASGSFHVTVTDTAPPSLTLPADITTEATSPSGAVVTFAVTATDAIDGIRPVICTLLSGSTFALGTTPVTCSASDTHGNTVSGSFNVTVTDTMPPVLTLPADITTSATSPAGAVVTYVATATDAIDGVLTPTCTPASGSTFPIGTTPVTCSAFDTHGNTASGSFHVTVVDTTPPDTSVASGPTSPTNATTATFIVSGTDDVTPPASLTFECSLDGGGFSACTSSTTYSGLPGGSHTLQVRARDAAGNVDLSPVTFNWSVDTAPPDTILDSMPSSLTNQTTATVTFHATEPGSTFECSLDGGAFTVCTSPAQYTSLADGPHTFQVRAIDPAGNSDPTPASVTWTVDTLAPDTMIDSHPADPTTSNTPTFTFHAGEGSTFVCQLDAEPSAACNSGTVTYPGLGAGSHTFTVTATDLAGNPDPTPTSFTWSIDVTPPDTSITAGPADSSTTTTTSTTFDFAGTDNLTLPEHLIFECSLDGAPFAVCTSPTSSAELSRDTHTFAVQAKDAAGNTDPTPAMRTWTITKLMPLLTWSTPADITYPTSLSATQLNATADVAGSFVYTPASGTVLNAGDNQDLKVDFTPTDTTNYSTASKIVKINVKKATPTVTFTGAPATASYGATFTVASTTNSSSAPVYIASGACANSGTLYTITGSTGICTATVTWAADTNYHGATRSQTTMVVDSTPPTTTAVPSPLPNSYSWNNTDVTVSLHATDNVGGTGVREIAFTLTGAQNGGGVASGDVASVTITAEGITTLTYFARDNAGNQETAKTLTVQIDKTAPELAARCAPPGSPLVVVGRDGGSGATSVTPGVTVPLHQGKFKERRTFIVFDLAGNQLQADFGVKAAGQEAPLTLLSLAYNGHVVPDLPENELKCEWALEKKTGAVKELEQKLTIKDQSESRSEHDKTEAQAKFRAGRNETEIRIKKPEPDQQVTRPGLVFLRLTTNQGDVGFDF